MTASAGFNDDFLDMLRALDDSGAQYLVVGAHAMALHGVPRATGDMDLLVRPSVHNAERVIHALEAFGAPIHAHDVTQADFEKAGTVYQVGLPPRRIDILTSISGVSFDEAWRSRQILEIASMDVSFLSREALIRNKLAAGRDKDLLDVRLLQGR